MDAVEKVPERATVPKQRSRRRQVGHPTIPGLFIPAPKPKRTKRRSPGKLEKGRKEEAIVKDSEATKVNNYVTAV